MKRDRSLTSAAAVAVGLALAAAPLWVAAQTPSAAQQAIKYRQAALTLLGYNIGPISAMMKGEIPFDARKAELHATRLAQVTPMILEGFPADSQTGAPTKAKPEIWQNMDDFSAKMADLEKATAALVTATRTGEQRQVGAALGGVGNACKACHDSYRAK
jgi:cytochrome c556